MISSNIFGVDMLCRGGNTIAEVVFVRVAFLELYENGTTNTCFGENTNAKAIALGDIKMLFS
jgi:hypothetical protein